MEIIRSIIFALATFWIFAPASASEPLHFYKKYTAPDSHNTDLSAKSSEATINNNDGNTSVVRTSAPQTPGSSLTTYVAEESSGESSLSTELMPASSITLNALEIQELNRILEQRTTISDFPKAPQATEQTTVPQIYATFVENSTINGSSSDNMLMNATSVSMTSPPDVVSPTKGAKTYIDDIFKQSLSWLGDTYTLSIMIPILAGFLFAVVIIVTVTTFACIRRRCRRRRLRRKILPDAIRKMGPSDRARLLAETSDEEF